MGHILLRGMCLSISTFYTYHSEKNEDNLVSNHRATSQGDWSEGRPGSVAIGPYTLCRKRKAIFTWCHKNIHIFISKSSICQINILQIISNSNSDLLGVKMVQVTCILLLTLKWLSWLRLHGIHIFHVLDAVKWFLICRDLSEKIQY